MASLVKEAGLTRKLPQAEESFLFSVFYPEVSLDALMQLDRLQDYDALIVDEAQDLMSGPYLDVFDALVKGGINNGNWYFFYDPFQDIFTGLSHEGMSRLVAAQPAQFSLSVNCRNTAPIAIGTAMLSTVDTGTPLITSGPEIERYWYHNANEQRREIAKCVNRLLSEGLRAADMVILSLRRREHTCLREGLPGVPFPLVDTNSQELPGNDRSIRFATVHSFKGLEADAVLLIELDDLSNPETRFAIYVGASRARALLALFLHEQSRKGYEELAQRFGEALARKSSLNVL